jgi:hypothetical protein
VMLYNLPPNKCLKGDFIFLALIILGPKEPNKQMNIYFVFADRRAKRTMTMGRCIWQSSKILIQLTCCLSMINA